MEKAPDPASESVALAALDPDDARVRVVSMRPSNTLGAIDVRWSAWVRTGSYVEDSVGNQTVEEGDDVAGARLDDAEQRGRDELPTQGAGGPPTPRRPRTRPP